MTVTTTTPIVKSLCLGVLLLGILFWASSIVPVFASNDFIEVANFVSFLALALFVPGAIILSLFKSSRSWIPLLVVGSIVLLSVLLIAPATEKLNKWQFNRQMQIYNRIIEGVKSGNIKDGKIQNQSLPQPINYIRSPVCDHGVVVEFHKQGRCGYLFDECGTEGSHYIHIQGAWYKYCVAD